MNMISYTLIGLALAASAAQVRAQGAAAPPAPAQDAAPDATAGASAFSDAEIDSFAQATLKVRDINADSSIDESQKQQKMAEAVTAAGLEPAKYNAIGKALASDADLRAKVQAAIARHTSPGAG